MIYNFNFTNSEIKLLKSKRIVRNNLNKANPLLTEKIDNYVKKYNLKFNEIIYLAINKISESVKCPNCKIIKPNFISTKMGYKKYCSNKCSNNHKDVQDKKKKKYLEKYGVDNPSKSEKIKKKLSLIASNQSIETKNKRKKTCLERYGYVNNLNLPSVKEKASKALKEKSVIEKRKKTCLERYGVEYSLQNNTIREKCRKTCKSKFGTEYPMQNKSVQNKFKKTCQSNFGFDNPSKSKEILDIKTKNNITKYGVKHPMILDSFKQKAIDTSIEKYGVHYPMLSDVFKEKSEKTKQEKYGKDNQNQNEEFRKDNFNIAKDHRYVKYLGNQVSLFKCDEGHYIELSHDVYSHRLPEYLCHICYPKGKSNNEIEMFKFINQNYNGEIIQSYRDGKEIDVYLPGLKLGFEFNGLYYHSDKFKDKNYHINKTEYFKERGIRIIHIWEDDWLFNNDIVKSQILNWIGNTPNKIYGRKCIVKEINAKECRKFLDENHIQGKNRSVLKLGLFLNEKLVSVMTFDHFEGRKKINTDEWNLSRFCNIKKYTVIGGASKLFKYFIKNYDVKRIVSYSDNDWSNGKLYDKLGFTVLYNTTPDYKYIIDKKRTHKSKYRKSNLKTNLSESLEMKKRNILKVWDCGKTKHELLLY